MSVQRATAQATATVQRSAAPDAAARATRSGVSARPPAWALSGGALVGSGRVQRAATGGAVDALGGVRVSEPGDAAEHEAVAVAQRVVRMPARVATSMVRNRTSSIAARAAGAMGAMGGASLASEITAEASAGTALPETLRTFMESRFGADFGGVRVHTGDRPSRMAASVAARAFTYTNHLFFARGAYDPDSLGGRELIAHELAHVIQQGAAAQREGEARVTVRSSSQVQRLGISDALDYFADAANNIPGFRMFTIVLGLNPINMSGVDRSAANIMRAVVEFLPGGGLITQALDNHGVFDRVGGWVEQQIRSLGMTGSVIRSAISRFLDSLSWRDIFRLGDVWSRARRIFTEPIDRIIAFARGLVTGIIRFVKEAILRPLARLAEGTRGYDLLKAVLGEDPVTGDAVPRNAETLIGGFMRLIGQEEIWQNIQRGNAIGRAWAWFQTALSGLMGMVRRIPQTFVQAFQSLEIMDIVLVPRAFARIASVFGGFIGEFLSWAGGTIWDLLEIIFSVVAPNVMVYVRRAAGALRTILRDPIGFVRNLVRAGMQGLRQFASNFLTHLRASLIGWLTGAMSGANIYIPQGFNLMEIVKFVLSVLGLTWANIRAKLVRATSETVVRAMETTFDIVVVLVTQGPAAAWQRIVEGITNLRDMVIEQVMTFVRDRVVTAAITRLVSMLSPAGAFIQAIIATYNTVMFFVERLRQIAQVAASFIDSISAIAGGNIGAAASRVEQTMAGLLTLVISFLARIAGLGRVSDAVTNVINRVRQPIDRALDRVVNWIVEQARRLGRFVAQAGVPADPNERLRLAARAAIAAARRLTGRVGRAVLTPLLGAVRVRYGLTTIEPFERGGRWWVRAVINPAIEDNLQLDTNEADRNVMQSINLRLTRRQVFVLRIVREVAQDLLTRNAPRAREIAGAIQTDASGRQIVNVNAQTSVPALAQSIEERGAPAGLNWTYRYDASAPPARGTSTQPVPRTVNVNERYGARGAPPVNEEGRYDISEGQAFTAGAGGSGDYADIHDNLQRLGLSHPQIAEAMSTFARTRALPAALRRSPNARQLVSLFHLLFIRETARSRANIVMVPMMNDLVETGRLDYRDVLRPPGGGELPHGGAPYPASMQGAVAATRRLDRELGSTPRGGGDPSGPRAAEELARREYEVVETWLRAQLRTRAEAAGRPAGDEAAFERWIDAEMDRLLTNRAEFSNFIAAEIRRFYNA